MGEHDDKVFFKRFGGVMLVLLVITITIIVIADQYQKDDPDANPSRQILAAKRVTPVGDVRTELPVEQSAQAEAASAPDIAAAPFAAIDGGAIYGTACLACHMSGAAGAPIPGSDAWTERTAKGLDALASSAINGIGVMPAKGGRPDLSDDEIRAAVEHMLSL